MNKIFLLICFLLLLTWSLFKEESSFQIYFFDVGQGDGILVRGPQGENIVVDGGPDNSMIYLLGKHLPWWERDIDYLIISHYHADHMMSFIELLNKYKVKNVLVTGHQPDDFLYNIWQAKLAAKNIEPTVVEAGEKFVLAEDFYLQVFLADTYHKDYNENSLVVKLTYQDKDFLLTGDLGMEGEKKILDLGFDVSAEYLKVGHHGSRYSSSLDFLQAVSPKFCIIQSGQDNEYGHPHQEAIDRFLQVGCQILDTRERGDIGFSF